MFEMVDPLPGALRLKMPRFVIAWSIVDLVLCSLRALELPFLIAALILMERCGCAAPDKCPVTHSLSLILWLEVASAGAVAVTGLAGNIGMLCRRRWALYFCSVTLLLTLASYGIMMWQTLLCAKGSEPFVFVIALIAALLFIMLRMALLVFNTISLFKARHFFKERDGY